MALPPLDLHRSLAIPRPSRRDTLVALALAAVVLFLFREAAFGGLVFYERDIHLHRYPRVESFVTTVLSGSWPRSSQWKPRPLCK